MSFNSFWSRHYNNMALTPIILLFVSLFFMLCSSRPMMNSIPLAVGPDSFGTNPSLKNQPGAGPSAQPVVNMATMVPWPNGQTPKAPPGFKVSLYSNTEYGRWIYVLDNGDVLVSESRTLSTGVSPNRILLLRDMNGDGAVDMCSIFLENLNQPFGIAVSNGYLFVGCTGSVMRFPFIPGALSVDHSTGLNITMLAAGGYNNHWTRNVFIHKGKLYVTVGSASDHGEFGADEEEDRACVLEMDLDGSNRRVFASGIRNPVGVDIQPKSGVMWTVVNERDLLGDDIVPDYLTRVRDNDFYGWPWYYWKTHVDTRVTIPKPTRMPNASPDYAVGPHTASIGLVFYNHTAFPAKYRNGAFIGQHGSWNRRAPSGYAVVFVPFNESGMPSSNMPEDFLTGFRFSISGNKVFGRPAGVAVAKDGALLVADDWGGSIWRISYTGEK